MFSLKWHKQEKNIIDPEWLRNKTKDQSKFLKYAATLYSIIDVFFAKYRVGMYKNCAEVSGFELNFKA